MRIRCLPFSGIILAAGSGSRMGRAKQLLEYHGQAMLGHVVDQAVAADLFPLVVVLGAMAAEVRQAIAMKPVEIAENIDWELGMGSSVGAGMRALFAMKTERIGGVAVLLGDQPLVRAAQLREMQRTLLKSDAAAIAASYGGTLGVPAMFRRQLFAKLLELPPNAGAKVLLQSEADRVLPFPLPEAATDVDTPADWEKLKTGLY